MKSDKENTPSPQSPVVSVLMPVYNTAPFVAEAIESILSQSFADFEFIIIDDGSTDGSAQIVEQYAKQDCRIQFVSRGNRGCYQTRNEASSLSRGEFIAAMDSDDISLPERLALEVEYLRDHPECVAVGGWFLTVDPDGMPIRTICTPLTHEEIDAGHMRGSGGSLVQGTMMFRRDAYIKVGGYSGTHSTSEDMELCLRLAEVGRLANIPKIVLMYRRHLGSMSSAKREHQRSNSLAIIREAYSRRDLPFTLCPVTLHIPLTEAANQQTTWVYDALIGGHVATARKHAWQSVRNHPLRPSTWCALATACVVGRADRGLGKWLRMMKCLRIIKRLP